MAKRIIIGVLVASFVALVIFLKLSPSSCDYDDAAQIKQCWEQKVQVKIQKGDIAGAFDSLVQLYDTGPAMGELCHSLTHEIGRTAYRLFARDVRFAITPQTAYCSYGFYHGFMEELVIAKDDMQQARNFCDYVDRELSHVTPDVTLQCYHGIGHGTVNNHDPRTWGKAQALVDPAIALCEEVSLTVDQKSRCATGVFNGLAIFYGSGEYGLTVDKDNPVFICSQQLDPLYQDACYVSMNTLLLQLANYDLNRAASYLEHIPDDTMAEHAMINLAAPVGTRNLVKTDHSSVVETCRGLVQRLQRGCIQGYAFGFMEHGEPEREYVKSIDFCESKYLTTNEQNACFEYIFSYLPQWYGKEKVEGICATLDHATRIMCNEAVGNVYKREE